MLKGQSISKLIDEAVVKSHVDENRDYIGSSSIGNPCSRAIWYAYKGHEKKPLTAKQIRTFEMGKILEEMIKEQVRLLGFPLNDGSQFTACYDDEVKVFQGNVDGLLEINGRYVVLEIKTANDANFQAFFKKGLKAWSPSYYAQVQAYMGMKGVSEAYIVVLNKNTAELHDEHVQFDDIFYHELKAKAKIISEAEDPPERINKSPLFYVCGMCQYKEVCHG
jgi:hypothetical protein